MGPDRLLRRLIWPLNVKFSRLRLADHSRSESLYLTCVIFGCSRRDDQKASGSAHTVAISMLSVSSDRETERSNAIRWQMKSAKNGIACKHSGGSQTNSPCNGMSRILCATLEGDSFGVCSREDRCRDLAGVTLSDGLLGSMRDLSGDRLALTPSGGGNDWLKDVALGIEEPIVPCSVSERAC